MTAYNTGVTGTLTAQPHGTAFTLTVPAGVAVGDVMIVSIEVFTQNGSSNSFGTPSSGGGNWTQISSTLTGTYTGGGTFPVYGMAFYRVATASDPGSTFTMSYTGTTPSPDQLWWAVDLEAYTGFYTTAPIGNVATFNNGNSTTITAPTTTTTAANSWEVDTCPVSVQSSGTYSSEPLTNRHTVNTQGINSAVSDSNGSVGGAGTTIGGGNWVISAAVNNSGMAFTIELLTQAPGGPGGGQEQQPPLVPPGMWTTPGAVFPQPVIGDLSFQPPAPIPAPGSEQQPPLVPPGMWTSPGAIFPQPVTGDPGILPYYGIPQFLRPAGQVPRLGLPSRRSRFAIPGQFSLSANPSLPSFLRPAEGRRLGLRRSQGRFFNPGQWNLTANPSLPSFTRPAGEVPRLGLRRSQGQFFAVMPAPVVQPPAFTSGGEAPVQIAPPFTSPGSFYQPWQPPGADPSFSPAPPSGSPSYIARQLRPFPARQPRGRFAAPGSYSLSANPSLPSFITRQERPFPARAPRGRFFNPGQWNLTANPSLPQFLRPAGPLRIPARLLPSRRRTWGPAWPQANQGQAWPSFIRQAGTRARMPRVIRGHRFDPGWGQAVSTGIPLDPYTIGGHITADLMAGIITRDNYAGAVRPDIMAGSIT